MATMDMTTMSAKGQVVIPKNLRGEIKEGDRLVVIKEDNTLLLKKATDFDEQLQDDLEFARRTEEAYKSYERGEFEESSAEEFLEELEKC